RAHRRAGESGESHVRRSKRQCALYLRIHFPIPHTPEHARSDVSTNNTLLLVEKCSHCISWYDIESGRRVHSVALPDFPHEFVTDRDNRHAWVGHYGVETSGHAGPGGHALLQIDIAAGKLVRTIDLSPFNRIHGLQMDEE